MSGAKTNNSNNSNSGNKSQVSPASLNHISPWLVADTPNTTSTTTSTHSHGKMDAPKMRTVVITEL